MREALLIAVAGAVGSVSRYGVNLLARKLLGEKFPFGTLAVNVLGCLVFGFVMHVALNSDHIPRNARIAITTGFLGAFTTFSTFGYETITGWQESGWVPAVTNVVANVVLGLAAAWGGLVIGKALVGTTP